MSARVTPIDVARRVLRARVEPLGDPGRFLVLCGCGWSSRANGRRQADALKGVHDRLHRDGLTRARVAHPAGSRR